MPNWSWDVFLLDNYIDAIHHLITEELIHNRHGPYELHVPQGLYHFLNEKIEGRQNGRIFFFNMTDSLGNKLIKEIKFVKGLNTYIGRLDDERI